MKRLYKVFILIIGLFLIGNINALAKENIEITNIKVSDKSETITVDDLQYSNNTITSNISFNKLNDYVVLDVTVKNNTKKNFELKTLNNGMNNENISIESNDIGKILKKDSTNTIKVKITYTKELLEGNDIVLNNVSLGLVYSDYSLINPKTGQAATIPLICLVLIVSTFVIIKKKKSKKAFILLLLLLLTPAFVYANESTTVNIKFNNVTVKKINVKMNLNPEYFFMTADESMDVLVEILREWGRTEQEIQEEHIADREGYTDGEILERFLEDFEYVACEDMEEAFEKIIDQLPESEMEAQEIKYDEMHDKWHELMRYLKEVAEERGNEGLQDPTVRATALQMADGLYEFFDEIGLLDMQYGYSFIDSYKGSDLIAYGYTTTADGQDVDPNKTYYVNGYGDVLETAPNPHTYRMHFIKYYE